LSGQYGKGNTLSATSTREGLFLGASRPVRYLQLVALILLIGPQWIITRDLFDGATVAFAREIGNPDGLYYWFRNSNWLLTEFFFRVVFSISDLLGISYLTIVKFLVSLFLLGLYAEFFYLTQRLFDLEPDDSRFAGLLCLAAPLLHIWVNSCAVPMLLCSWLMFLGHRLFWNTRNSVRLAGLLLLAVSFQLNSNLVFALALDLVYLYRFHDQRWRRLKWFVSLFATAVAVYVTMRHIAPPKHIFAEYNQILNPFNKEDIRRIVRAILIFMSWCVIPFTVLALVMAVALVSRRKLTAAVGTESGEKSDALYPILASAFLCLAAAFPYLVVGKGPPLFTFGGIGNGLTEQVLRVVYGSGLAPVWSSTSARHALLFGPPLALLTWFLGSSLMQWLRGPLPRLPASALFALMLPLLLVWVLPAYTNRLMMQQAEISLVKGFKALPPAPAGAIDLRYGPVSDWLIWSNSAGMVLREAWGLSHYYAMFHSLDVYRDDLQWQYHAYIRATGGLTSSLMQHQMAMDQFPGERCISTYEAVLPSLSLIGRLMLVLKPNEVPAAQVTFKATECVDGRIMPNPYPDKKLIP
jgi:hypothetical protein